MAAKHSKARNQIIWVLCMNILIVEDDQLMQLLNSNIMEIWGYNYDLAFSGYEAVELALKNKSKYDLCLMDIEMPRMSGLDATRAIRYACPYFPIMAYTPDANYKEQCFAAGMDEFVEKPCPPERLFRIIDELTSKETLDHPCLGVAVGH